MWLFVVIKFILFCTRMLIKMIDTSFFCILFVISSFMQIIFNTIWKNTEIRMSTDISKQRVEDLRNWNYLPIKEDIIVDKLWCKKCYHSGEFHRQYYHFHTHIPRMQPRVHTFEKETQKNYSCRNNLRK